MPSLRRGIGVGRDEEGVCETLRVGEAKVRVGRHRYSVTAPDGDWIGSAIQRTGRPYEQDLLRTLGQFAQRSSIVLDVGANIGNHVLYFALVRGATVHAFEPNPIAAEYLRTNIERNGAGDVRVHEVGLSDADGRGRIAPAEELGMARLEQDDSGEIDVRRLDSYDLPPHPRITVMKIDVEGAEARVLKGAEETIRTHRPMIAMEAFDQDAGRLLYSLGYRRFPLSFCSTPTYIFYPGLSYLPALACLGLRAKVPVWRGHARARLAPAYRRLRAGRRHQPR
jgi:FkbM family methyltransferase